MNNLRISYWHMTYCIVSDDLELLALPLPFLGRLGLQACATTSRLDSAGDQAQGFMHSRQALEQLNERHLAWSFWFLIVHCYYRNTIHFYVSGNLVEPVISCRIFFFLEYLHKSFCRLHRIFPLSNLHTCSFSCFPHWLCNPEQRWGKEHPPPPGQVPEWGEAPLFLKCEPTGDLVINAPSDDQACSFVLLKVFKIIFMLILKVGVGLVLHSFLGQFLLDHGACVHIHIFIFQLLKNCYVYTHIYVAVVLFGLVFLVMS